SKIFTESLEVTRSIEDTDRRANVLSAIAASLAQAGHIDESLEVARSIEDTDRRTCALSVVALSLAQAGQFCNAFFVLQPRDFYDYLSSIAKWVLSLERLEPSFYLSIIIEVVRIVGWVRPQWYRIHDILTISR